MGRFTLHISSPAIEYGKAVRKKHNRSTDEASSHGGYGLIFLPLSLRHDMAEYILQKPDCFRGTRGDHEDENIALFALKKKKISSGK
jgi:hypothetical protein